MFDLNAPLGEPSRRHGSAVRAYLAASQRWVAGFVSCALCGELWPDWLVKEMEWDHIVPTSKGGPHTLRNSQLTCPSCNKAKADRPNAEAIAYLGNQRGTTAMDRQRERQRNPAYSAARRAPNRERMWGYRGNSAYREQEAHARGRARFGKAGGNARLPNL